MDLSAVPIETLIGPTFSLVLQSVRPGVRRVIAGTDAEKSLRAAYKRSLEAFLLSLPEAANAYKDPLTEFLKDADVARELATIIEPGNSGDSIDVEVLN